MDWFRRLDNYCERIDPSYWSEPLNAVSDAAFLVAALLCWRMPGARSDPGARLLIAILAAIGVGSYLFHTHARGWALIPDVVPIQAFILVYFWLATTRFFGLLGWAGLAAVVLFVPFDNLAARAVATVTVGRLRPRTDPDRRLRLRAPPPGPRHRPRPRHRRRSPRPLLFFRTVEAAICAAVPVGTHFIWHLLNGLMLGWMIAVLIRHGPVALGPGPSVIPKDLASFFPRARFAL